MTTDFTPDLAAIAAASADVSAARAAVRAAEAALAIAEDALADAEGDVAVAQAKADNYSDDDTKKEWQRVAAARDLDKRTRAKARAAGKAAAARANLQDAQGDLEDAEAQLDLARRTPAAPPPSIPDEPPGPAPEVVRWVGQLVGYVESPVREESTWCTSWFEHPEAVWRLSALYTAFVAALVDDDLSAWWVNHFDRHAPALFGRKGIFEACASAGHTADRPFRYGKTATP